MPIGLKNRVRKLFNFRLPEIVDRITALEEGEVLDRSVTIHVQDSEESAVEGVTVTLAAQEKTTNAEGVVTFSPIEAGEYTVRLTKEGYKTTTAIIIVEKESRVFFLTIRT